MGESAPGEVAEMDFGRLGLIEDPETGRRRAVWALIIVLTYSRHSFVWPVQPEARRCDRGVGGCLGLLRGRSQVPGDDNFPAAVAGVDPLHPRSRAASWSTPSTGASSQTRRGCAIPGTSPVERGVPYVRERFFKGRRAHEVCGSGEVWKWPDRGYTAPPASSPWSSSR